MSSNLARAALTWYNQDISIFEKDRAHIVKNIKQYNDQQNQRERAKEEAAGIAKTILGKKNKRSKEKDADTASDTEKLATAVQIYQEEREELISEIKLLRALATNGLMTTTMVHDLKSINALLVSRVRGFKLAIRQNDTLQIQRNIVFLSMVLQVNLTPKEMQ